MNEIFEKMKKTIIPVVTIDDAENAVALSNALLKGGIKIVEFTYRTRAASRAISSTSAKCPEIITGAGTVTKLEQAMEAIACGAKFIVSPGTDAQIIDFCNERKVPIIPGIATPSEVVFALSKGAKVLKFFPASLFGGPQFLDAMAGPFSKALFVPSGGISEKNAALYLQKPNVLAVSGSWIVKKEFLEKKDWGAIENEAKKACSLFINQKNEEKFDTKNTTL